MTTVAAVDIGSNSVRLLVDRDGTAIERRSEITRLGERVGATGHLSPDAVARTAAVLRTYHARADELGAHTVRAVATAAARAAANADELLDAAGAALGIRPELISGDREAQLTFAGVVAGLPDDGARRLVVDIGGGSTEMVVGTRAADGIVSLEVGSASLTEAQLPSDPPRPEELSNAIAIVQEHVDDAIRALDLADEVIAVVGVGGTVTTVAAVEVGLAVPDPAGALDVTDPSLHGFMLTRAAAEDVFRTLAGEPWRDRVHNPGLPRPRAGIIVGGCCILVGALRRLQAPAMVVSLADLLDGLVAEAREEG